MEARVEGQGLEAHCRRGRGVLWGVFFVSDAVS